MQIQYNCVAVSGLSSIRRSDCYVFIVAKRYVVRVGDGTVS